jgi:putative transposase
MLKAFKYQIYPNQEQKVLLAKHFGCARWMYNWGLTEKIKAYEKKEKLSCFDIINRMVLLKKSQEFFWLNEVNSQCLQMAARNLDNAFQWFFKEKKGFPKFKSRKNNKHSFQCPQHVKVDFGIGQIKLPKFKDGIKAELHRQFEGKIKTVTISQVPSGKYFASILVETVASIPELKLITENGTMGIDTGIKTFLTLSNGKTYANNKYLKKSLRKLKKLNRAHSRKKKDSKNRNKARIKLAKQYEKVTNQRNNYIHQVTAKIVNDNQVDTICIEDLNVKGIMKNHKLARAMSDVAIGRFYEILKYKCEWKGINLIKIGRFEASSKTCSVDGYVNHGLTLKDRNWICPVCQTNHDRDLNAAINIKKFGLLGLKNSDKPKLPMECRKVKPVDRSVSSGLKQEAFVACQ